MAEKNKALLSLSYSRQQINPNRILGIILAVLLAYLVLVPVLMLLADSVMVHSRDAAALGRRTGSFTLAYMQRALSSRVASILFWKPLLNTVLIAAAITLVALGVGYLLAWIIARTDVPLKKLFATLAVIPFMLPSWSYASAWITVFKNRRIAGPPGFMEVFGITPPDSFAYGPIPIIICLSMHYFPLAYIMFGNAFQRIDSQLEESAQILGASRRQTAWKILLPIMKPAIMSAILLTFARTVGTFGTPYTLGRVVNFNTLSTSLYSAFHSGSPGVMSVIAIAMVLIGALLVAADVYVLKEAKRFVTMSGKGQMSRPTTLGKSRIPLTIGTALFLTLVVIIPLGVLTLSTVMVTPGWFVRDNFTAQFWFAKVTTIREGVAGLFRDPAVLKVIGNSVVSAGIGAAICGILGTLVGYGTIRLHPSLLSKYLRHTSFLPYLVPGIGFGAAYLLLFAVRRGPVPVLYGTLTLLILAMGIMYLPYTARSSIASISQMGSEPEEAAMILGARWMTRFSLIVLPIQRRALFSGMLLAFIQGMKELSLVIMLAVPGMEVLTTLSIRYTDNGLLQMSNGVILIITAVTFALTVIAQRLSGSNIAQGLGG
ncbi:MAG: iron ABC transporter permease [Treponema sp.]|jgi:iron(III) transport system permease protein|nr:iron ABC transporter permease [Treponema sp.]